jgi:hypothetical protein
MPTRIAMKLTEEILATISHLTGSSVDPFGDKNYAVFTIIDLDEFEFNVKFVTEEAVFEMFKNDSNLHILGL